jgi:endo-1,4-beta-xylanase
LISRILRFAAAGAFAVAGKGFAAPSTLREATGGNPLIGCALGTQDIDNPPLARLVARQFDCLTADNQMMPAKLVDESGRYTFADGDRIADFAQDHGLKFFGQMFVWHHVTRAWLFEDARGRPLPRAQALSNLRSYILAVGRHYRGRVTAWNVVNEALSDEPGEYLRPTPALRAIGDDYIAQAFAFAQEADPGAELYYNDYNVEEPAKRAQALRLLRSLRARGLRVDAIGIQGHWTLGFPELSAITDSLKQFHQAGFKVFITELDIDVLPRTVSGADLATVEHGPDPFRNGLPAEVQAALARRYAEIFAALLNPSPAEMITFWGPDDGRSWLNDFPVRHRINYPLLFDRSLRPKPAFYAVRDQLQMAASSHSSRSAASP